MMINFINLLRLLIILQRNTLFFDKHDVVLNNTF